MGISAIINGIGKIALEIFGPPIWIRFLLWKIPFLLSDLIKDALSGKRIAVLGAKKVGKSIFIGFITKSEFSTKYRATIAPQKTPKNTFRLEDIKVKLKESKDVTGQRSAYKYWESLVNESDYVLYMIKGFDEEGNWIENDAMRKKRVEKDLKMIKKWIYETDEEENNSKAQLLIGITHCDLDKQFPRRCTSETIATYRDSLEKRAFFKDIQIGGIDPIIGSLKTKRFIKKFAFEFFKKALSHE